MTDRPLVTVIVPTKNSARTLGVCLSSIKNQSYQNIELVVVDNNSTDATKEIAKKYTEKVFNYGPERSAQVNYGVTQANGEYVYKVDSDFVLDPKVVEECVNEIRKGFQAIVVHNSPDVRVSWIAEIRKFEVDMYKYDLTHSSARFVKKSVYEAIGGFNEKITAGEDYDFQNKLNRAGYKTGFIEAEALHLGEPRYFWAHMKKYYVYGKDFVNYSQENKKESSRQLGFFRGVYLKNWKRFLQHPFLALKFIFYNSCKFGFGGAGFLVARIQKKSASTDANDPKHDKPVGNPVMIQVSQFFLPSLGGKQIDIDRISRLVQSRGIAEVEIVTIDSDVEKCRAFDRTYPMRIFRVSHRLTDLGVRLHGGRKKGVLKFYGGRDGFSAGQKIGLVFEAGLLAIFFFRTVRSRLNTHKNSPMILCAHDYTSLFVILLARRFDRTPSRIRTVFINGSVNRASGFWPVDFCISRMFRRTDLLLCVSRASADALITDFKADPERTTEFRLWTELQNITENSEASDGYADPLRIAFVGRISPEKGIKTILDLAAFIDAHDLQDRYRLTVIGDSDHEIREDVRAAAATSRCLKWLGRIDKPALWTILHQHDVLFVPSLCAEGAGNVIVEAAACGLGVVGANVGGIPEYARLLPFYRLVDRHDPESVIAVFQDFATELRQNGRRAVIKAQREAAHENFSEKNFDVHEHAYRRLFAEASLS